MKLLILILIIKLKSFVNGVTFDCTFTMNSWAGSIGSVYTCWHVKVSITDGEKFLTAVTGNHLDDKSNQDVQAIYFYSNNCPFVPKNIDKHFPKMLAIQFSSTNLKAISSDDLRQFPMLRRFGTFGNPLQEVDADLFDNNPDMEYVNFSYNVFSHFGYNFLDKLSKLTEAFFYGNVCIDFGATTPEQIVELKVMLNLQCQPSASTESTTLIVSTVTEESTTTSTVPIITTLGTTQEPTCELIEEIFLCKDELSHLIDIQVADRTNPLVLKVYHMDHELIDTTELARKTSIQQVEDEKRISQLEQKLSESDKLLTEKDRRINVLEKELIEIKKQIAEILNF